MSGARAHWRPSAAPGVLAARAAMLARARRFFAARRVLEVETPALDRHGVTDPNLANARCRLETHPDTELFLQTSPEFAMKRLLAAGSGDIYQVCRVFRDAELGPRHQPEFTMIEWYRTGSDLATMARETCDLIQALAAAAGAASGPGPARCVRYAEAFEEFTGLDPLTADARDLVACATARLGGQAGALIRRLADDRRGLSDLLLSHLVLPGLADRGLVVISHFPADQAALARLDPADPRTAERFEVFWDGLELANGYRELIDPAEQARRFAADNDRRRALALAPVAPDPRLLAALEAGLPDCCGVAVGFDRVVMRALGLADLGSAVAFALAPGPT